MPVRLFVGNLSYDVTESDLREFFSPVGALSTVIIPTDRETGKPRGFAFVEFSSQEQAGLAVSRFNNQPLKGRNITINEARAREPRPGGGAAFRPGGAPRPAPGRMEIESGSFEDSRPGRAERRNRSAKPPPRRRGRNHDSRDEFAGRKGPIRERSGGQFYGDVDDEDYEDEWDSKSRR
ncbi:MAG: RNA-binding protein [Acidobacteria bacterium]|nr:RNA-binding protein [Acidobacteriota bacterium]